MSDALIEPLLERWIYPMVKAGREFHVPYGEAAWRRIRDEGGYPEDFYPFLERCLRALAGPGWAPGSYYPGGWYRSLQARGLDPGAAAPTPEALQPFYGEELRVDADGRWWMGQRPVRGRVLRYFQRHLVYAPVLGRYAVRYPLEQIIEKRYLHHESPPVRVQRLEDGPEPPRAWLNTGEDVPLHRETLRLTDSEQLDCTVTLGGHAVPARFDDVPRWQVLQTLEERDDGWWVRLGDRPLNLPVEA